MHKKLELPPSARSAEDQEAKAPFPRFVMPKVLILDPELARALIVERQKKGIDKYDEVWEGVYVMPATASNAHQDLVYSLTVILGQVIGVPQHGRVQPGANVSDRRKDWESSHRCPDIVVVLKGGRAIDCDTHWFGGPDFLVEIQSPNDETDEKIPFYSRIGVRELLIIWRDTRQLRLFRHDGQQLTFVEPSDLEGQKWLVSEVVPLTFRRKASRANPRTELRRTDGQDGSWIV
jgi:Uma2 family endonuclease